jgi:transposase-like protein
MKQAQQQQEEGIAVKPYTTTEIASIYGMSSKTILRWIKKHEEAIGKKEGRYYTVLQVKMIFEKIGLPYIEKQD